MEEWAKEYDTPQEEHIKTMFNTIQVLIDKAYKKGYEEAGSGKDLYTRRFKPYRFGAAQQGKNQA